MRKKGILITGAAGEIGDALIHSLAEQGEEKLLACWSGKMRFLQRGNVWLSLFQEKI